MSRFSPDSMQPEDDMGAIVIQDGAQMVQLADAVVETV